MGQYMRYTVELKLDVTVRDENGRIIEEFGITDEIRASNGDSKTHQTISSAVTAGGSAVTRRATAHSKMTEENEKERLRGH